MARPVSTGTVLVTGGARRIGRAVCCALASRGFRVLIHARRADDSDACALAAALGGVVVSGDLSLPGAADRLFDEAARLAPELSFLVNNAAVFSTESMLPPADGQRLHCVNTEVPLRLTELLSEHVAARTGADAFGAVVDLLDCRILRFLSSCDTDVLTPYEISKLQLARSVRVAARTYAPVLRVNGLAPGPALAPVSSAAHEPGGPILLAARPSPADVAGAVVFFLESPSVTGQILAVDSGQSLL